MTEVVMLPQHARPINPHTFVGDTIVPGEQTLSNLEQRERYCPACGLYKITITATGARRYRWGMDGDQFQAASDPPCLQKASEGSVKCP